MKRFLHYVNDDIEEIKGHPRWMWLLIPQGLMKLTALLKAHAELQRRYPEGDSEVHD